MDMNMEMPTASASISSVPTDYMSSMDSMSSMASTFSINTRVTLWFTEWTTTTPAAYVFTIFFLFSLGLLNRFLGALKSQLERRWKESPQLEDKSRHGNPRSDQQQPSTSARIQGHVRSWSRRLRPDPLRLDEDEQETEPLSPAPPMPRPEADEKPAPGKRKLFVPSGAWSLKKDSIRALLEFIRALIGYILYVHFDRNLT